MWKHFKIAKLKYLPILQQYRMISNREIIEKKLEYAQKCLKMTNTDYEFVLNFL